MCVLLGSQTSLWLCLTMHEDLYANPSPSTKQLQIASYMKSSNLNVYLMAMNEY